jgi:hypothetical protein
MRMCYGCGLRAQGGEDDLADAANLANCVGFNGRIVENGD